MIAALLLLAMSGCWFTGWYLRGRDRGDAGRSWRRAGLVLAVVLVLDAAAGAWS